MKVFKCFFAGVLLFLNLFIFFSCKAEDPSFLMGGMELKQNCKDRIIL